MKVMPRSIALRMMRIFVRVMRATDVMAAQPDRRDFFVGLSETSIDHSVSLGLARRRYADAR